MIKQLICGALLLSSAAVANAAVIVQSYSVDREDTDFTSTVAFNLFDNYNTGGVLQSVFIELFARSSGSIGVENKSSGSSREVKAKLSTSISLQLQGESINLAASPESSERSQLLTQYDNTDDKAGTSGVTFIFSNTNVNDYASYSVAIPAELALFIGSGQRNFIFDAVSESTVTAGGNLTSFIETFASGDVSVTYTYVSEAPAILLFIIGVGLIVMRQNRKQNV